MLVTKPLRAGESVEDYCRACKTDRMHTVIAADQAGTPIRVQCGYCRSEHNFRGGPRLAIAGAPAPTVTPPRAPAPAPRAVPRPPSETTPMPTTDPNDLEALFRRVIREESGLTPVEPADKWRGGTLVLRPGRPGLQEKTWPVDAFFHKIVMLRNRLRTLEQQINAADVPEDAKVKLQTYITGCYGSLTSFNVLFADEGDAFKGTGGD
jgi:hypothetical protein